MLASAWRVDVVDQEMRGMVEDGGKLGAGRDKFTTDASRNLM
jgi:hypothetical protein